MLEEKQEELKVQKDEIKLLRMTVESYDSKVNEQTDLINKLEKELTNVKGRFSASLNVYKVFSSHWHALSPCVFAVSSLHLHR